MAGAAERGAGPAYRRAALGRVAVAMLLLLAVRARAEQLPIDPGFDQALAAQVFTTALSFMAPRTLEPVGVPQMTIWGLRGITALDPSLVPVLQDAALALNAPGRTLLTLKLPAAGDVAGWGTLIATVTAVAWRNSEALRRAGAAGVIGSFFDEVFNHLDPYSRYVPPDAARAEREHRRGAAGIGVSLSGRPGAVAIGAPVPLSPADGGGLKAGDRLTAVDGVPAGRADAAALQARLSGEDGTPVRVTLRGRDGRTRAVTLQRALVPADTVTVHRDGALLVLRVAGFTASTAARLGHELGAALSRTPQPHGLVIDLRGNRGGLLREAVAVASLVLPRGLIATTVGRDPDAGHRWEAAGADAADGLPLVVLVDGRSASAAEVLAAALSDDARAVVVGSATLGKGLVQTVAPLPDGGELFVTWSRVLAPAGWPLQGLGVMPHVCTSLGREAVQRQLAALSAGTQPMRDILATHRAARPNVPLAEILTIRDACPAAIGGDTDLDAAKALIGDPVAYATALGPA